MGITDSAYIGNSILNTAGSMLNAQQGNSTSFNDSWGSSGYSTYGYGESYADSVSDAWSRYDAQSSGSSWSQGNSWSAKYGSEATAKDIELTKQQNALQRAYWNEQMAYNMTEAEKDRAFQQYMSNTSYQRAVADLISAGLNPILAAGMGGASTPVGAMATTSTPTAYRANVIADERSGSSSKSGSYNQSSAKGRGESWSESHAGSWNESSGRGGSSYGSHGESGSEWGPAYQNLTEMGKTIADIGKTFIGGNAKTHSNSTHLKENYTDASHGHYNTGVNKPFKS